MDVIQLMGVAAKKAAECSLAMTVANEYAGQAASAFEEAAKAQEALGLDATGYWLNAALFRGIVAQGEALNFKSLVSEFVGFSELLGAK